MGIVEIGKEDAEKIRFARNLSESKKRERNQRGKNSSRAVMKEKRERAQGTVNNGKGSWWRWQKMNRQERLFIE